MISIEYIHKLLDVYNQLCRPLCQQTGIPQTSLDILMFLKNNPQYKNAADIVKIRGIKANLVSHPCGTAGAGRISRTPGGSGRPEKDRTDLYPESGACLETGM